MNSKRKKLRFSGFSLLEILVVLFILGLFLALVVPSNPGNRNASRDAYSLYYMIKKYLRLSKIYGTSFTVKVGTYNAVAERFDGEVVERANFSVAVVPVGQINIINGSADKDVNFLVGGKWEVLLSGNEITIRKHEKEKKKPGERRQI